MYEQRRLVLPVASLSTSLLLLLALLQVGVPQALAGSDQSKLINAPANGSANPIPSMDGNQTPLQRALLKRRIDMARVLVSNGALVDAFTECGLGEANACKRRLSKDSSLIAAHDAEGRTLLHWSIIGGQTSLVDYLLRSGADLEAKTKFGMTPLHVAVQYRRFEIAKMLLERGAAVDARASIQSGYLPFGGAQNCTPLQYAAKAGYSELVELLLAHKANINAVGAGIGGAYNTIGPVPVEYGFMYSDGSPLYWAVYVGNYQMVQKLLKNGADANIRNAGFYFNSDKERVTPLDCAARNGRTDIVKLLLQHHADPNCSGALAYAKNADIARALIAAGARTLTSDCVISPLITAAANGNVDVVKVLIDHGADVNQRKVGRHSPLFVAVDANAPEVVRVLLAHGAKIEKESGQGNEIAVTPIEEAERRGFKNIAEIIRNSQRWW